MSTGRIREEGMRFRAVSLTLAFFLFAPVWGEGLITLEKPDLYDLQVVGFEIPRRAELQIEAVGTLEPRNDSWWSRWWSPGDEDPLTVYAWLLDSRTREPVWTMRADDTSRVSKSLRSAEGSVQLEAGRYELYLFSGYARVAELVERGVGVDDESWWERWFSGRRRLDELGEDLAQCYVTLSSGDLSSSEIRRFDVTGAMPDALIQHNRISDSEFVASGFSLERPTSLRVYSIYEKSEDGREAADYGWIVDAATRELVWHPRDSRSSRAGGGEKNRRVDEEIELPAGRYVLYYGTDDSHSFEQFNVAAPHDPFNWGITLLPGKGFEASSFTRFEPGASQAAVVEFVQVDDDAFHQQPFRVSRDATLLVYALGEYDYDDDQFYDHGWIVDAASGSTVWEMTGGNTEGAGGAEKNRMFDGLVELPRGDYILFYVTDGSHAYGTWNGATPFDADSWGITLRPGPGFETRNFTLIDEADLEQSGDYLVRIVRVGDDERIRKVFALDGASWVEIRATGEGSSGEMYDFGYIRDKATGRVVWEMDYDQTEHAGGASKNRIAVDEVRLEPGEYEAVYVTDGSHSFRGWNASRPRDPMNWGLTIRRVDH